MLVSLFFLRRFLLKTLVFIIPVVIPSIHAASRQIHAYPTSSSPAAVPKEEYRTSVSGISSGLETTTWTPSKKPNVLIYSSSIDNTSNKRSMSSIPTISDTASVHQYSNPSDSTSFTVYSDYSANPSPVGEIPYEMGHAPTNYYNNNSAYYYNNNSSSYADYQTIPYRRGARVSTSSLQGQSNNQDSQTASTFPSYYSSENGNDYSVPSFGNYQDGHQYNYGHVQPQHREHNEGHGHSQDASIEIEDKVFSKTVVATKALKVGKIVMTFFMVLVVLAIACLGKMGVAVSPVVLPFALLPIGVVALLLFIPLFLLFIPLAATGLAGEKRKRRKRDINQFKVMMQSSEIFVDSIIISIEDRLHRILDQIGTMNWEEWIQDVIDSS